ncbi:right-handed parallel beta-helix repeat-containing protein [Psychrobacter pygoscelis]|uniref:right-handed parallel beta-helix repeat-containing protein n=1 Tax=Psychrobacter pygoscelis TaxID=2488563 RepID=UPI00103C75A6|nr:right-handed parallel beta-helix repeat-containing protein [Psychrobacter pygoscelis]
MAAIHIEGCTNSSITHCYFDGFEIGVSATDSSNIKISNLNINNCKKGIVLNNCLNSEVSELRLHQIILEQEPKFMIKELPLSIGYWMNLSQW